MIYGKLQFSMSLSIYSILDCEANNEVARGFTNTSKRLKGQNSKYWV